MWHFERKIISRISIRFHRMERSNDVLRNCDELLRRSAGLQNPLLEKKKASLERRKKEFSDLQELSGQSEPGTCTLDFPP